MPQLNLFGSGAISPPPSPSICATSSAGAARCTPADVAALLSAAVKLIAAPGDWCQGATARDATGRPVAPTWPNAVKWSGYGAIARLTQEPSTVLVYLDALTPARGGRPQPFARWHDLKTTTHAAVLEVLRRAAGAPPNG